MLATIVVNSTADTIAEDGVVTLREAITSANNNANVNADVIAVGAYGADTINFDIPGMGVRTIQATSALPTVTGQVTIDGYSQPGASPNTLAIGNVANLLIEISGTGSSSGVAGLDFNHVASGSTVRGLVVNRFGGGGSAIRLSGNFQGFPSGITIEGNFLGTDPTGSTALPNTYGIVIADGQARIGGSTPAARNLISGNTDAGIIITGNEAFHGSPAAGTLVQGNYVGTNAIGAAALANGDGILVGTSTGVTIGGDQPGEGNVVSGNTRDGISAGYSNFLSATNLLIGGNLIGVAPDRISPLGNGDDGVEISAVTGADVGGTSVGAANVIAFNAGVGIALPAGFQPGGDPLATVLGNSIFSNGQLGIDLRGDGVTPNDPGDTDNPPPSGGTNGLQNFPVLTSLTRSGGVPTVSGALNSTASTTFRVEFFASAQADPSCFGEGQTFLGAQDVTTDAVGNASFTFASPVAVPPGQVVTATATDPAGNTSEFSNSVAGFTVITTADSGPGSLREAILGANANPGPDVIGFCIPASGVQTISPSTSLPVITDPVVIDGYTQPGSAPNTNTPDQGGSNAVLLIELSGSNISGGNGLHIVAADSTVRGLVINRFAGNGIQIDRNRAVVAGNFIGVDSTGTFDLGNSIGVEIINGNDVTIGGITPDARNVISGNAASGVRTGTFFQAAVSGTLVLGNLIGTDRTGTKALANDAFGVQFGYPGANSRVGGDVPAARNIISGNGASGILFNTIFGIATNNVSGSFVRGNYIGTDATGRLPLGNVRHGVEFSLGDALLGNVVIGGETPADRNIIAFNGQDGVSFSASSSRNVSASLLANAIFGNGGLGVDLNDDGVTPNDANDSDTGPNNLQNFPVITSVSSNGGSTAVSGTLNSAPNTAFRIEFFANDVADPSSFGEGQTFLGSQNITTDASGNRSFTVTLPVATTTTQFITAAATRLDEQNLPVETSEFSQLIADLALAMTDTPEPVAVGQDLVYTLNITNRSLSSPSGPTTMTDTLPDNVTFVSAATSQGAFTQSGNTVTFSLGTIALGGSATATITVRPAEAAAGTTVTNSAAITSTVSDPDAANNSATETTDVTGGQAPSADLQVTKSASSSSTIAGTNLTYTITVANNGPAESLSVSLTDAIPDNTTFVSAIQTSGSAFSLTTPAAGGPSTFTATADLLAVGAIATFQLVVHAATSVTPGAAITNTASVTSSTPDPDSANNSDTESTSVVAQADLQVSKSATPSAIVAGNNLIYTIIVTNAGPSDARSVSVSDILPPGTTFVSFAAPDSFTTSVPSAGATGTVIAAATTLATGQTATFQLVVRVESSTPGGTAVNNTVQVATATTDSNLANNIATTTTQVLQPAIAQRLTITLVSRQAKFKNEFGLFFVDDASGRIGTLRPGDPGYARAALARTKLVFTAKTRIGTKRMLQVPAGGFYGMYLVQNSTSAKFLARNPENRLGRTPLAFFSFQAANADGFEHVRRLSPSRFAFEDMTNGGDKDYNDLIIDIRTQVGGIPKPNPSRKSP